MTYRHHNHLGVHQSLRLVPSSPKVELQETHEQHPWCDLENGIYIRNGRETLCDPLYNQGDGHFGELAREGRVCSGDGEGEDNNGGRPA